MRRERARIRLAVMRLFIGVLVLLAIAPAAYALSTPERNGWVTDEAGILDSDTASAIATNLIDLQRKTGDEVVVVTLKSLQGASIETWGNLLGESWSVGRSSGHDTGVLLIVAPDDRKVRIAVGYGLGNRISDPIAAMIISDHILPYFRQGDFAGGVKAGVSSIALQLDRSSGATTTEVERGAYPIATHQPGFWTRLRYKLTPSHHTKIIAIWVLVCVVIFIWMVLNVGNVGGRRRRRRNRYDDYDSYDDYDDDSPGGWFSTGGSSGGGGSSSSSSGGSFGGGATGSW